MLSTKATITDARDATRCMKLQYYYFKLESCMTSERSSLSDFKDPKPTLIQETSRLQDPVVAYRAPPIRNNDDTNIISGVGYLVYTYACNVDLSKEMDITELNNQILFFKKAYRQMELDTIHQS